MRLVSALLFVALTGSAVLADEAKPADPKPEVTKKKVPFRVVKMLPETGQVLLFDKNKGTHVVAEVGQTLDGYAVQDIDDDEVTLVGENGTQVILTAPATKKHVVKKPADTAPADPYIEGSAKAPVDPYADDVAADDATSAKPAATGAKVAPVKAGAAPVDPYADPEPPATAGEGGVRVAAAGSPSAAASSTVPAMADPATPAADPYGDPGIAAFAAAVGATPATPAVHEASASGIAAKPAHGAKAKAAKGKAAKAGKAAPTTDDGAALAAAATGGEAPAPATPAITTTTTGGAATATAPAGSATVIARSELDGALSDFGKLAGSFRATFTPDGLRFDAVADGTLLAKAGLRKGDVVTAVDGQPLRSMDDAANLYARAGSVKSTTIQVVRAGKPVTLRIAIQ